MSEKRKELLVIDINYILSEYKTNPTDEVLETLKKLTGFENILLIDPSRANIQCSNNNNNNTPAYTL